MRGRTYYSDTLPKGKGDTQISYDKRLYNLANQVYYHASDTPQDSVVVLQELLLEMGYLDEKNPQSLDRHLGPMTLGAAYRYLSNFSDDYMWDGIKSKWDSLWGE